MKIIEDLRPQTRLYRFTHPGCCVFEADGSEFKWTTGQYNERVADVVCPLCGKQFYDNPEEITPEKPQLGWPPLSNCPKNCKICKAKCIYRKEKYNNTVCPKD